VLPRNYTLPTPDSLNLRTDHEEEMTVATRTSQAGQSDPIRWQVLDTAKVSYSRWLTGKGRPGQPPLLELEKDT